MPTYIRKFWIQKHNRVAEEAEGRYTNTPSQKTITGEALNDYAAIEQGGV